MRALILALLLPSATHAACSGETLLACNIGADALQVCLNGDTLTYTFTHPGAPDFTLSEPLSNGTYTPWNGIGGSIWESISFRNADYSYDVYMSFDRMAENAMPEWGVAVSRNGDYLTTLTCDTPGTAMPFDGLYGEMEARGFCWNRDTFAWATACPD